MEHPDRVLHTQQGWLSSNGYAIVSLPNIAFLGIRLQLLLGRLNYRDVGILDRTDLRFYALATAKELSHGAHYLVKGFEPVGWLSTIMPSWFRPSILGLGLRLSSVAKQPHGRVDGPAGRRVPLVRGTMRWLALCHVDVARPSVLPTRHRRTRYLRVLPLLAD